MGGRGVNVSCAGTVPTELASITTLIKLGINNNQLEGEHLGIFRGSHLNTSVLSVALLFLVVRPSDVLCADALALHRARYVCTSLCGGVWS